MSRPATGLRILLTRPEGTNDEAALRLEALGAHVIVEPLTRTAPLDAAGYGPLDRALERPDDYAWILFTSAAGVRYFLERAGERGAAIFPPGLRVAAVGPKTAEALAAAGRPADLVPGDYRAEGLAAALTAAGESLAGRRILFVRALEGRNVLIEALEGAGVRVDLAPAYRTVGLPEGATRAAARIARGEVDLVLATSGAALDELASALSCKRELRSDINVAALGPVTAEHARDLGFTVALVAQDATLDGLIESVAAEGGRLSRKGT